MTSSSDSGSISNDDTANSTQNSSKKADNGTQSGTMITRQPRGKTGKSGKEQQPITVNVHVNGAN